MKGELKGCFPDSAALYSYSSLVAQGVMMHLTTFFIFSHLNCGLLKPRLNFIEDATSSWDFLINFCICLKHQSANSAFIIPNYNGLRGRE